MDKNRLTGLSIGGRMDGHGDCSIRCLAAAADIGYGEAYRLLKKHAGKHMAFNSRHAIMGAYGEALSMTVSKTTGRTVTTVLRNDIARKGIYIIWTTRHIFAVIDGIIVDWIKPINRHRVRAVYKVSRRA